MRLSTEEANAAVVTRFGLASFFVEGKPSPLPVLFGGLFQSGTALVLSTGLSAADSAV